MHWCDLKLCMRSLSFANFIFAALYWPKFQSTFICTVNPQTYRVLLDTMQTQYSLIQLNVEFNDTILLRFVASFTLELYHITEYAFRFEFSSFSIHILLELLRNVFNTTNEKKRNPSEWKKSIYEWIRSRYENNFFLKKKSLNDLHWDKSKMWMFLCATHNMANKISFECKKRKTCRYREK